MEDGHELVGLLHLDYHLVGPMGSWEMGFVGPWRYLASLPVQGQGMRQWAWEVWSVAKSECCRSIGHAFP